MKLILTGRPITKKNSQEICYNPATKRRFVRQSACYLKYEEACLWQLKTYRGEMLTGPVEVTALYYLPDRRSHPDLVSLMQATGDILQKARIIANDKFIVSWDGSRIMGVDKKNPRAEITIRKVAL